MTTYERLLADILLAEDPTTALAAAVVDPATPPDLRDALRHVDPDGLRITALFVARLRFERLLQGDPDVAAWFTADPEGFAAAFHRYHHAVRPTAFFPRDEATLFNHWRASP